MIFKCICRMLHFVIFIKILEYRYIAKLLPLNTVAHNCCISGCFKSLWRSIRGRVIVSRVNRIVLKICHQTISVWTNVHYPPREETAQKEERSAPTLCHKFQKHRLTPQFCVMVLGPRFAHEFFFLITKCSTQKISLKIDLPYLFGYSSTFSYFLCELLINRFMIWIISCILPCVLHSISVQIVRTKEEMISTWSGRRPNTPPQRSLLI